MTDISEHHTKEEWEGDNCEITWIYFFVHWYSISVSDLLESTSELVHSDKRWRSQTVVYPLEYLRTLFALSNVKLS